MRITIRIAFALFVIACLSFKEENNKIYDNFEIAGLASPIILSKGISEINLADYFKNSSAIDRITIESVESYVLAGNKQNLSITIGDNTPPLVELKVWVKKTCYSILIRILPEIPYRFTFYQENRSFQKVSLSGDMNGWDPEKNPMEFINGQWITKILLNPGTYQYQYIADGLIYPDPSVPDNAENPEGGINSVITVGNITSPELPKIFTLKYKDHDIIIGGRNKPEKYFILWQNFRIEPDNQATNNDKVSFTIPQLAGRFQRSFIRVWAYNKTGISNDILIPLEFGKVVNNIEQLNRDDLEASVIYSLLIDRFSNANIGNDRKINGDTRIEDKVNFFGGDISGLVNKVSNGYFSDLGINTLMLSPLVKNPWEPNITYSEPRHWYSGYPGYWPQSLSSIDPGLGQKSDLHKLIQIAHEKNINVILDFTTHHVHETNLLFQSHPDWATLPDLPDGQRNIRLFKSNPTTTWFDTYLPTWNFSNKELLQAITDSAFFWITKFGFDGLYDNDMTYLPDSFNYYLMNRLKNTLVVPENKRCLILGKKLVSRKQLAGHSSNSEFEIRLDYTGNHDATNVFAKNDQSFIKMNKSLNESFYWFGYHNLMANFTGNNDLPRFITFAGDVMPINERDKEFGWMDHPEEINPNGYKKLSMFTAYVMTIPGIPFIYYGDEIGLPGTFEPDNHKPMKWENLTKNENQIRQITTDLIHLRKNNLALIYGDFETLLIDNNLWIYCRSYFDKFAIIIFNKEQVDKQVTFQVPDRFDYKQLKALLNTPFTINKNSITLDMQPLSFEVLSN